MKREFFYERRQTAGRMEACMYVVTGIVIITAIFAFLRDGWVPGAELLILAAVAFALSRVFDLIGDLFTLLGEPYAGAKTRAPENPVQRAN